MMRCSTQTSSAVCWKCQVNAARARPGDSQPLSSGAMCLFTTLTYWKPHMDIDLDDATAS